MTRCPFLILAGFLGMSSPALVAQSATPATLDQMEAIYQRELSTRHIPLISRYLIDLQSHTAAPSADSAAWQTEIVRVQQLLKAGGVINLATARSAIDNTAMPMPMPAPLAADAPPPILTLTPANAADPKSAATPVADIQWPIRFIAAGSYDIHLQYACPDLKDARLPLQIELDGRVVQSALDPALTTPDAESFRLVKLGQITLPDDVYAKNLRLICGDGLSPALHLKQIFVTPSKSPPPGP
jgi:hypothetical protein